jgi:hypothetical protein
VVSIVDACIEDIYEACLAADSYTAQAGRIASKVRSAWATGDDGLTEVAKYILAIVALQPDQARRLVLETTFDSYCEIREIRHALVHNAGTLAPKRRDRLLQLHSRLPEGIRRHSWATRFLEADSVELDLESVLTMRKWTHDFFLMPLRDAFTVDSHAPDAA